MSGPGVGRGARGAGNAPVATLAGGPRERAVNLPNAISAARIVMAPLIAMLPFIPSPFWRAVAFVLYIVTAVSDYVDGKLARTRGLVTDLGKALDPLADKLLLVATFVPMLLLQGASTDRIAAWLGAHVPVHPGALFSFPFITWFGTVTLPTWVIAVVLGRELFMTVFRQAAQRRGVVIAAITSAKWKAGMQYTWVGAAYFEFAARTLVQRRGWGGAAWDFMLKFSGLVGVVTMWVAVALTLYSFALYMRRYGAVFARR